MVAVPKPPKPLKPLKLFSDEPPRAEEEEVQGFGEIELGLGGEVWAKTVASCVLGQDGPFAIGVYGSWGKGKTSLIHRVMFHVAMAEADNTMNKCVFVNAWIHERSKDPLPGILQDIYFQLDNSKDKELRSKRAIALILMSLVGIDEVHKLLEGHAPALHTEPPEPHKMIPKSKVSDIEGPPGDSKLKLNEFLQQIWIKFRSKPAETIQNTLNPIRTKKKIKIVIFIDDLDRCHPDKAVKILEALKLILWHHHFVFVLALDDKIITDYLTDRYIKLYGYKEDEAVQGVGKKYLEKIIQLPFPIPEYSARPLDEFYKALLKDQRRAVIKSFLTALQSTLIQASHGIPRALKRLMNQLIVDLTIFELILGKISLRDARALAINRILPNEIGNGPFRQLINSQPLCDELIRIIDENSKK